MKKTLHTLLVFCLTIVSTVNIYAQIESDLQISAGGASGGNDLAYDVAHDEDGNIYVCGLFRGTAFFESTPLFSAGGIDIFLAKYSPSGDLIWVRRAGGTSTGYAFSIAVNGSSVYISGQFNGTANFNQPSATGSNEITSAGQGDVFLAKYNTDGDFQWAKRAGGTNSDGARGIVATETEVYITGYFLGTMDFNTPSAAGSNEITSEGSNDIFIAKYDTNGNFLWAKRAGGAGSDVANGIAVSGTEVYITGYFRETANFNTPAASGSNEIIADGNNDVFVAKYTSNGDFLWAKRAGGTGFDVANGIAVNGNDVYITGSFRETANFNTPSATGSNEITSEGNDDIFIAKYDTNGDFQWAKRAGGNVSDIGRGIAVNGSEVYITGLFRDIANFNTPSALGSNEITSAGSVDVYVAKYTNNGDFEWAKRAGGASDDIGYGIAIYNTTISIAGKFEETTNFNTPSVSGSNEISSHGGIDIFIAQYNTNGDFEWAKQAGGGPGGFDRANRIALDEQGDMYVCGIFNGTAYFEGAPLFSAGSGDIFIAKYSKDGSLVWVKRAGGTGNDGANGIAVSGTDVYITGWFNGTANFNTPSASGSNEITSAGSFDIFLAKYDTNGNFQWAKRAGGTGNDGANGIAASGTEVYITGFFRETANFNTPSALGSNEITSDDNNDIFIAKYDVNGNFQWAKRAGGTSNNVANDIAVNGTEVYITGSFDGTANFNTPSAAGSNEITADGDGDIFLAKYNNNGDFQWARRAGGIGYDGAYGLAVNGSDVYICGEFSETVNFNTPSASGSNEITSVGNYDSFLAKYNSNGDFQWARQAGGIGSDVSLDVAVNNSAVYITGGFSETANFNTPTVSSNEITSEGLSDIFVAKYNDNGDFQWARRGGGTNADYGNGVAVNETEVYIAGGFHNTANFNTPSSTGSNEITSLGSWDIFIARFTCFTPMPTGNPSQKFCNGATVADLTTTSGNNINWYDESSGGISINSSTPLINDNNYFASQTDFGCESTSRLMVTAEITSLSSNIIIEGITLTAEESDAAYQWLDCDNNTSIPGEISQTFTPTANGNYAVEITKDECITTTSCITVSTVGINEQTASSISVYPNPSSGKFTLITEQLGTNYTVIDNVGRVITQGTINHTSTEIDLTNNSKGLYLLSIQKQQFKLIKQ